MNTLTFQYFSDIHLEFFEDPSKIENINIKPCAPYLIIAGDIDNMCNQVQHKYEKFLNYISPLFQYIFIISGNHEYYRTIGKKKSIDKWLKYIDGTIRDITKKFTNVIYLQNEIFNIPNTDIVIFGSTMWSEILQEEKREVNSTISDYTYIPNFSTRKSTELFTKNVNALTLALESNKDKRFIVISHHLPSYDLIHEKYKYAEYNSAFASNIEIANNKQIVAWVAGHTHCQKELGKFHVNPIGYPKENIYANYNKTFTIISA